MAEWSRTDVTYIGRIQVLQLGIGLNGSTVLNYSKTIDDGSADTLRGGRGSDWFLIGLYDITPDHASNEEIN
jgi:hypothetical protein